MEIALRLPITFALLCGALVSNVNADTLRTVAFTGDPAPGTDAAFAALAFYYKGTRWLQPSLNNAGHVAFYGSVDDGNKFGIWSEGSGSLALVARNGRTTPGPYRLEGPLSLNDAGQTVFVGEGVNIQRGLWLEGNGSLELVTHIGSEAPGTNREFVGFDFVSPILNDIGQTAFQGRISGPRIDGSNYFGIWSNGRGPLALVAGQGDLAPGTSAVFSGFDGHVGRLVFNSSGQTAFQGYLIGPGVDDNNRDGIWSEGKGSLGLVARSGSDAPGADAKFLGFGGPTLNDAGQTAFRGSLSVPGALGIANGSGIWAERDGSLALIARDGNAAPGTSEIFSSFGFPILNGVGQTAFRGSLTVPGGDGRSHWGIWSEREGTLSLVAREGSIAPGTDAAFVTSLFSPAFNDLGQVAFGGFLTGPNVDSSNDLGIWAQNPLGLLTLIAREGDLLDVDDGPGTDFRMIRNLTFGHHKSTGNEDGRASGFNDLGQLAFRATFTDGTSGIFVSNLVAVPEPSSLALLALAGLAMLRRNVRS